MAQGNAALSFDRKVYGAIVLWVLFLALYRYWLSPVMAVDDVEIALLTQELRLGYHPDRPALHNWLAWLVAQVTGPTLISILILKYVEMALAHLCYYALARRILQKPESALAAFLGSLMLYHLGFQPQIGFAHTMSLWVVLVATFLLLFKMAERRSLTHYLLLGLLLGAGLLTKPSYLAVLLLLPLATWLTPNLRPILKDRRLILSLLVGALVIAPYFWWHFTHTEGFLTTAANSIAPDLAAPGLGDLLFARAEAFGRTLALFVLFLTPFIAVWAAIFLPRAPRQGLRSLIAVPSARFVIVYTLAALVLMLLAALALGTTNIKERHLVPYFLLVPIWLFAVLEQRGRAISFAERRGKLYLGAALFCQAAVLFGMWFYIASPAPTCDPCRWQRPYPQLAEWMEQKGLNHATLIAGDEFIGANLLGMTEGLRVYSISFEFMTPPPAPEREARCLLIWEKGKSPRRELALPALIEQVTGEKSPTIVPQAVSFPFLADSESTATFYWTVLPAKGDCR